MLDQPTIYSQTGIALFHGVSWNIDAAWREVYPGLKLCRMQGSGVEKTYQELCEHRHVDDGEPFHYEVYATIAPESSSFYYQNGYGHSQVDRLANMIAIATGQPPFMCRTFAPAVESKQNKISTEELYWLGEQNEFLIRESAKLDETSVEAISKMYSGYERMWAQDKSYSRLVSAQSCFYNAWRSMHIQQICLNLAIAAEMLFSPNGRNEITHQLAFNFAKFHETDSVKRLELYRKIKKFYGLRSAVVHGGLPEQSKLIGPTVEMFGILANVLERILTDDALIDVFNENTNRNNYLTSLLFDTPIV